MISIRFWAYRSELLMIWGAALLAVCSSSSLWLTADLFPSGHGLAAMLTLDLISF